MFHPKKYIIKQSTAESQAIVKEIHYRVNINTLEKDTDIPDLKMNDIAEITIRTAVPLVYDAYSQNHVMGSLVFVDPDTNETVGGGMIIK